MGRPRRLAALKALSNLSINVDSNDSSPSSSVEEGSDSEFLKLEEDETSSNDTSATPSEEFSSAGVTSGDETDDSDVSVQRNSRNRSSRPETDSRGPGVPPITHILPPFGRIGFSSPNPSKNLLSIFKDELDYHTSLCASQVHPFSFYLPKSGLAEISLSMQRQKMLFSLDSLIEVPESEVDQYLPESFKSPSMVFMDKKERTQSTRYTYDSSRNILYTGGFVKCMSWSPPFLDEKGVSMTYVPRFLAIASYANTDLRVNLSDPVSSEPGLVQVWAASGLALTAEQSQPRFLPHFFLAHDWGYISDLRWLPTPVQCTTNRPSPASAGANNASSRLIAPMEMSEAQIRHLCEGVAGHLLVACSDGFVRVLLVPAADNRTQLPERSQITVPTRVSADGVPQHVYKFKPESVLKLGPSSVIPSWLGWPNVLAIRSDFSHRLVVGYTSGHVGLYNLATLNPFLFRPSNPLMVPVLLTHLISGPFTSIALHPLYEGVMVGLGFDREINVWNLEKVNGMRTPVPELSWSISRMGWGGSVVWPRAGDSLWVAREEYIFPFATYASNGDNIAPAAGGEGGARRKRAGTGKGAVSLVQLKKPTDVPSRMRAFTGCYPTISPVNCSRHCFDRGFEAVKCLEYSDAFALVMQGDSNGMVNFHSWVLEPRRVMREKTRLAVQRRHRAYQWTMRKRTDRNSDVNRRGDGSTVAPPDLELNPLEEPFTSHLAEGCDLCGANGQALCWHKVEEHFEFVFREGVGLRRSKYDFVNSCFSTITKLAPSPDPSCASWVAVGTGFGVVQLICHDQFYHPAMDEALERSPRRKGLVKSSFFTQVYSSSTGVEDPAAAAAEDGGDNALSSTELLCYPPKQNEEQ